MAIKDLRDKATQLVSYGEYPALATRVSIPNVNLLNTKGSILYGTGNPATSDASIDGTTYQYAEVKALNPTSVKSVLFNDGDGNLSWTNVVDNLTTNDSNKILSAKVGYDIDSKIHISKTRAAPGITMGTGASTKHDSSIAIGSHAIEGNNTGFSTILGNRAFIDGATDCIAIGNGAQISQTGTRRYSSIQLGNGTNTTPHSFQVWDTPVLIDGKIPLSTLSPTVNSKTGLVLSNGHSDETMSYDGTVVLGPRAVATGQEGIAIGNQAIARGTGIAIGGGNVTANGSGVAIGAGAKAADKTIQLGYNGDVNNNETGKYSLQIGRYPLMGNDGKIDVSRLNVVKMAFGIFRLSVSVKRPEDSVSSLANAMVTLSLVYEKSGDSMTTAMLKHIINVDDSSIDLRYFVCNGKIEHYAIADAWVYNGKFCFRDTQGTAYEEVATALMSSKDICVFNTLVVEE